MSSRVSSQIAEAGRERASETSAHVHMGTVINYHGNVINCKCERHAGEKLEEDERHSIDVEITTGDKTEILHSVPCFVYSQGVIHNGFLRDDRVLIQYMDGDKTMPIASAYYREPSQLDVFWNDFKQRVAGIFLDLLPKSWDDFGISFSSDSDSDSDSSKKEEEEKKDEGTKPNQSAKDRNNNPNAPGRSKP